MVTAVKQSVDPTKSEPPPISESKVASPLRFLWLIGLFFVGFLLIVMLNKLFSNLIDELGRAAPTNGRGCSSVRKSFATFKALKWMSIEWRWRESSRLRKESRENS